MVTYMNISKVKSEEEKGRQQTRMVYDCKYHWRRLYNAGLSYYDDIMNIKAHTCYDEHYCSFANLYHFNPKKW